MSNNKNIVIDKVNNFIEIFSFIFIKPLENKMQANVQGNATIKEIINKLLI